MSIRNGMAKVMPESRPGQKQTTCGQGMHLHLLQTAKVCTQRSKIKFFTEENLCVKILFSLTYPTGV
jgi:hypothetical protein